MSWTISRGGVTHSFDWDEKDLRTPSWLPAPRRTITPRQGTEYQTFHKYGKDWTLAGKVDLPPSASAVYVAMQSWVGDEVTVSDGVTSWITTLDVCLLEPIVSGIGGWEGRVAFSGRR